MKYYLLERSHTTKLEQYIEKECPHILAQHTLEWHDALKAMESDEACYIVAEHRERIIGFLPLFLFKSPRGNILQSSPYPISYGGIVTGLVGAEKETLFAGIFGFLLTQEKLVKDTILLTIVTSPFSDDLALYQKHMQPDFQKDNLYQFLDLHQDYTRDMTSKARTNLKRNLRISESHGLRVEFSNQVEDVFVWYEILRCRLKNIGAAPAHLSYYHSLVRQMFGGNRGIFIHVLQGSETIGSGLFFYTHFVADVFLRAVKTANMPTQAGTFLDYQAIKYFKGLGCRFLNWQSSPSKESNTYRYKQEWGSKEGTHCFLTRKLNGFQGFGCERAEVISKHYPYHYVLPYEEFHHGE